VSGTTAIAVYAAVIGKAGLAWQIYSWRRANSTTIRVKLSNAFISGVTEHAAMIPAIKPKQPRSQSDFCGLHHSGWI
jgi:hypothetical protein